jgi:phosphate transport system substrate-binding protein
MKQLAVLGIAAVFTSMPLVTINAQEVVGTATITGAGSTFAYPIVSRWSKAYHRWVAGGGDFAITGSGLDDPPSAPVLDYEASGSLAGTMRVRMGAVDFGASDVPLSSAELEKLGLCQFPIVIGGVVAVVNIDGVGPGAMRFTGSLLAEIFLGKVQTWSDPAIAVLNPDLKLPDAMISVVHRADGSGTTYNFANYLSKVSPEWRDRIGFDLLVRWPSGTAAKGNQGVSTVVRQTRNAIGYVEYAHAVHAKLSYAAIQNRAGRFVRPEPRSFQAAATSADWTRASDFDLLMTDAPSETAYPLVATVFILMQKLSSPRRARTALSFFDWALEKGAKDAADLGYVPLPQPVVLKVKNYWSQCLRMGLGKPERG